MSKVAMDRPRYVAFRLHAASAVSRRDAGQAILAAARQGGWAQGTAPQLTRYTYPHGIVRVSHEQAEAARALLAGLRAAGGQEVGALTLGTSGTLKALTGRLGLLQERGKEPGVGETGTAPPGHRMA